MRSRSRVPSIEIGNNNGHCIYLLADPFDGRIRYVGRSSDGLRRPRSHWRKASERNKRDHTHRWIRRVLRLGGEPRIIVAETFPPTPDVSDLLDEAERRWIFTLQLLHHDLTNIAVNEVPTSSIIRRGWKHTVASKTLMSRRMVDIRHRKSGRTGTPTACKPCIETTTGMWFPSITAAAFALNLKLSNVSAVCLKKRGYRSVKGHRFIFDTPESSQVAPEGLNATGRSGIGASTVKAPEAS
jgi:hypothetical protein